MKIMEGQMSKISVRLYQSDLDYLRTFPIEDTVNMRIVSYNEAIREAVHQLVQDLKKLRGHN